MIFLLDILFIPIVFFIGIVASWEDYKISRIRNKWIKLGVVYGALIFLLFFMWSLTAEWLVGNVSLFKYFFLNESGNITTISFNYFSKIALNSLIALAFGFIMWKYGLMAAGDAKLFFVFSFLLPLRYYSQSYLPLFPSFVLLINIYIPVFFFILMESLYFLYKEINLWFNSKEKLDYKKIFLLINKFSLKLTGFLNIFVLAIYLRDYLGHWLPEFFKNDAILFLIFYLFRRYISLLTKNKRWTSFFAVLFLIIQFVLFLVLGMETAVNKLIDTIKIAAFFMIVFTLLQAVIDKYLYHSSVKKIKIKNLRSGMAPKLNKMPRPKVGPVLNGGISQIQVKLLKEWGNKNKYKEIEIYQQFSFAIFMFLGVVFTIITQDSIINIIDKLFNNL